MIREVDMSDIEECLIRIEDAVDDADNALGTINQVLDKRCFSGLKEAKEAISKAIDLLQEILDNKNGEY